MKAHLFLFSALIGIQCNSQKPTQASSANDFLKWFATQVTEPSVSEQSARIDKGMISHLSEVGFSNRDSLEMVKQIEKNQILFTKQLFPKKTLLSNAEEKAQLRRGTYLFVRLSQPIFFNNKVWIYVEHFCGDNCGFGEIKVYTQEGKTYKLLLTKQIWLS